MNVVERIVNRHTPYSLMMRGLWILVGISFVESMLHWLPYTPIQLFFSLILLLGVTIATNAACALLTGAAATRESTRITALMLFFALSAPQSATDALLIMLAAALAILSKYVFATRKLHVFNPAAFALVIMAAAAPAIVTWWVGTAVLLPFVLILGLFVIKKTKTAEVVWPFLLAATVIVAAETFLQTQAGFVQNFIPAFVKLIVSSPILFVGTLMLSDPHTMPRTPKRGIRSAYGALVGALYPLTFSWWGIVASPELALVFGNIVAFVVDAIGRVRNRLELTLQKAIVLSRDTFEFAMVPSALADIEAGISLPSVIEPRPLSFMPGQSIEITLPHKHSDYRGIRRTFVLTSAPEDHYLTFCTTIPVECSSFKETLHTLQLLVQEKDTSLKKLSFSIVGPLGEPFFPHDENKKVLLIASGIGIASFMSYLRQLARNNERRDIVLLYSATSPLDFIYKEEIDSYKERIGLTTLYVPLDFVELAGKWDGLSGSITPEVIKKNIPDYKSRCWFIAGPSKNTKEYRKIFRQLQLPADSLRTQEYPGF